MLVRHPSQEPSSTQELALEALVRTPFVPVINIFLHGLALRRCQRVEQLIFLVLRAPHIPLGVIRASGACSTFLLHTFVVNNTE